MPDKLGYGPHDCDGTAHQEEGRCICEFQQRGHEVLGVFNCVYYRSHTNEPGCAVKRAVEEGKIHISRYTSYLSMLDDEEEGKYRKDL